MVFFDIRSKTFGTPPPGRRRTTLVTGRLTMPRACENGIYSSKSPLISGQIPSRKFGNVFQNFTFCRANVRARCILLRCHLGLFQYSASDGCPNGISGTLSACIFTKQICILGAVHGGAF